MDQMIPPEKFHLRCPSCNKLYVVASSDIGNETPEFDCVSCQQRFFFNYPPQDFKAIETLSLEAADLTRLDNISEKMIHTNDAISQDIRSEGFVAEEVSSKRAVDIEFAANKACPKCGAMNDRGSRECYSCHVIFEKLEGLPQDRSLKAQPSLVRKWRELAEDFSNDSKHEAFIMSCHQLGALKFAQLKYQTMKQAQGGDPLCDRMLQRIESLGMVKVSQGVMAATASQRPYWMKYLFIGPYALSALMILIGSFNLNHRNMIGGGIALAFCVSGLIMMIKGRIAYEDFT